MRHKPGASITAHLEGGVQHTLITKERQYVEPAMYADEAGWWCVSDEDGALYFVSDDGRVDLHDPETFACLQEGVGVTDAARDAYWREQAEAEHRRTFP